MGRKKMAFFRISMLLVLAVPACATPDAQTVIKQLITPPGFQISLFADNVPNARTLALGDNGVVYVGTRREGKVYALVDADGNGEAEKKYVLASGLYMPNGVAYKDNTLYVAEVNRIVKFVNISSTLDNPPKPQVVYDKLPDDKHHGWKYLRIGPDDKLYSAVGAPCNICDPAKEIYTAMIRLNRDGSGFEMIARGIRNTVGFDWHPHTGDLYFTDNGRDYMGDDLPPDELNIWQQTGEHFGYPYCHAGNIKDPEFGTKDCTDFKEPAWTFKAHMAPLGLRFYSGEMFPSRYQQRLFVAQHGSWNRSKPHGYRIASLTLKAGKVIKEQSFISGWLRPDEKVLGRPTDILQMPDGSLLITDDSLGVIYRVSYNAAK